MWQRFVFTLAYIVLFTLFATAGEKMPDSLKELQGTWQVFD